LRRFRSIDFAFIIILVVGFVLTINLIKGRPAVFLLAILATAFAVYKVVRITYELRAGVSITAGLGLHDVNYPKASRPGAFWWAIGIELGWLLLASAAAVWF
jgi:hypothetical protein